MYSVKPVTVGYNQPNKMEVTTKAFFPTRSHSSGAFGHICWRQVAVGAGE